MLSACEGLDDEHRGTAVPADERGPEGGVAGESLRVVRGTLGRRLMKQFTRRRDVGLAVGVGEQSIVADAMKAGGQYVQQEAAHELVGTQGHGFVARPAASSVVLPAEGDTPLITGDQPTVGDRHPMGIARQIGEHRSGSSEGALGIDHPLALAQRREPVAHPAQNIAFAEYRQAVGESHERVERLTEALRSQCEHWRMRSLVNALATLRGIDFLAAVTLVAEIGDFGRFARPSELMGYLGLVPSEYSTGDSCRRGNITKTGNSHARRILIQAAWNYRFPARLSRLMHIRQEGQPRAIREIAWRAQLRLTHRYRRLNLRKMHVNKICIAIARELAGFLWDVARQVNVPV